MTNSKWLRSALLGGVAVSVMATGAQADELSDLKATLEALQARVSTVESSTAANLPAGTNLVTLKRGTSNLDHLAMRREAGDMSPASRGVTIAITPTADLPAPVSEVTIGGYAAGWLGWQSSTSNPGGLALTTKGFFLKARGRVNVSATTETAIGKIMAFIEWEATDTTNGGNTAMGMRHAYGTWAMTPNWTLLVGQTSNTGASSSGFTAATVDTGYVFGWNGGGRTPMVRLQYANGPLTIRLAVEEATWGAAARFPDFAASLRWNIAGGHAVWLGVTGSDDLPGAAVPAFGFVVQAGAKVSLGDMVTFSLQGMYGRGQVAYQMGAFTLAPSASVADANTYASIAAALNFAVTDTVTFNLAGAYYRVIKPTTESGFSVHANVMWQPVDQMKMGWEVYFKKSTDATSVPLTAGDTRVVGAVFGAWFFF